ncbi:MAG: efflux RND transporter permease subunit [Blastocatellia bacterium]
MTGRLSQFVDAHGRALILIFVSFTLAGLLFAFRLPVSLFPETDFPRIVILVDNGIQPVEVQMLTVTRPLEEAIRSVPGITDAFDHGAWLIRNQCHFSLGHGHSERAAFAARQNRTDRTDFAARRTL